MGAYRLVMGQPRQEDLVRYIGEHDADADWMRIDLRLVLAAQRSERMSLPGKWEFPGGKIEPGESPEQALARELDEELHCQVDVGRRVATTEHEYDFGIVILSTFYCTLISGMPQLVEHSEVRWVRVAELDQLNWAPADVPAVRRVMRDLA